MGNYLVSLLIGASLKLSLVNLLLLAHINSLCSFAGFRRGVLPFTYLGVSLFLGALKHKWLQGVVDEVLSNFDKWKGSTLSMAGRMALINSVVLGSLLHTFMVYKWPLQLIKHIKKSIKNFLWTGDVNSKKTVMVNWSQCCVPIDEGGLSLKKLHWLNQALLSKLAWRVTSEDSFVFSFLR